MESRVHSADPECQRSDGRSIRWVLGGSGLLGFTVGILIYPTWHHALESAQSLAGLVPYERDNPFYLYHINSWTVLHQVMALLLRFCSERVLAYLFSGFVGMISYQALASVTYAFSRKPLLAIVAPLIIHFANATDFGPAYPVWLMGHISSYGILGVSVIVLILGLIGCAEVKLAAFCLGIVPCCHASLGAFGLGVVLVSAVLEGSFRRDNVRAAWKWFGAGMVVTVASFLVFLSTRVRLPAQPADQMGAIFEQFLKEWSTHHFAFPFLSAGFLIAMLALATATVYRGRLASELSPWQSLLLRTVQVACALAFLAAAVSHLPIGVVPKPAWQMMPLRLINVTILIFPALLIGLLAKHRNSVFVSALLAGLILMMLYKAWRFETFSYDSTSLVHKRLVLGGLVVAALALILIPSKYLLGQPRAIWRSAKRSALGGGLMVCIVSVFALAVRHVVERQRGGDCVWMYPRFMEPEITGLRDWRSSAFHAKIAANEGNVLAARIELVQLTTRRPIMLGAAINQGLYVPESWPQIIRYMQVLYDVDFWQPNPCHECALHPQLFRLTWESRSYERWQQLRKEFGIRTVVTYRDWFLQLPLLAESDYYLAYEIPPEGVPFTEPNSPRVSTPLLVEEGYRGFNLLYCNQRYFGLLQSEGAFDFDKASHNGYRVCIEASSLAELKQRVDNWSGEATLWNREQSLPATSSPVLIDEDYHGYNLILCDRAFYGLAQAEGAFDLKKVKRHGYRHCLEAKSLAELKQRIDTMRCKK